MRIKSVIDAASGVYACGASHLNLHRTNAYHPRHRETPQTLFLIHPPITRRNTAQCTPHMDICRTTPLTTAVDKPRNVWYNIAVDRKGKQ